MKFQSAWLGILACLTALLSGMCEVSGSILKAVNQKTPDQLYAEVRASGRMGYTATTYWFVLNADDYFGLSVQKAGTDIALSLLRPDGRIIRSVSCSHDGPLRISEVAPLPGRYAIQLTSCSPRSLERAYELTLSRPRAATRSDRLRVAGERLSADAEALIAQYRAHSTRTAIRRYEEALRNWTAVGDHVEEARTLNNIGKLYRDLGDVERSISYINRGLGVARNRQDSAGEAEAYLSLATIHLSKANPSKALEASSKALEISRSMSNRKLEAEVQYFLGNIYYETADYGRATDALEEAKSIWQSTGNTLGLARSLFYLAVIDSDMSRFDTGPIRAEQALSLFQSLENKQGEARTLTLLGHFQLRMGRKQEALNMYERARPLVIDSGDLFMEATLLNSIARAHYDLGDVPAALQFFSMALARNEALRERISIAYTLRAMGQCYSVIGDTQNALSFLNRALQAFRALSNKRMEGFVLWDMGLVHEAMGDVSGALDVLNRSLELSRSATERRVEASSLTAIGHIHEAAGETDRALQYYEEALRLTQVTADPFGEQATLYRIAHCLRTAGKLKESLSRSEAAIRIVEGTRASVANSALRMSYFASVRQHYDLYIDVLMRLAGGADSAEDSRALAFEASERARARTLLESIGETQISISEGIDSALREREISLRTLLDVKANRYNQLLSTSPNAKEIGTLGGEVRRLTAEYEELQGQVRLRNPRYAALLQPVPLKLAGIQKMLDDDTLLLEYALGEDNSYLWAVTRNDFSTFRLPKRSEIENRVRPVRDLMVARVPHPGEKPAEHQARVRKSEAEYWVQAAELSRVLLGPVASQLGNRRLAIVGEGILQHIPFGALPTPDATSAQDTPVILNHEVVNLPSASTLLLLRRDAVNRRPPDRTVAVFADPVFHASDSRVLGRAGKAALAPPRTEKTGTIAMRDLATALRRGGDAKGLDIPRLPATRQEAEAILRLVAPTQGRGVFDFEVNRAAVMTRELQRYRIVHFATHGLSSDEYPELSGLVLSLVDEKGNPQDGFLRLRDIYNLKLSAELVVLSACDTALGKDVKGEGLVGIVRGFMYAGAPRVVASLWKVDDDATAELMKQFYQRIFQGGLAPAAALREAQIAMWQQKQWRSPYYWAAFVLQGEWK